MWWQLWSAVMLLCGGRVQLCLACTICGPHFVESLDDNDDYAIMTCVQCEYRILP